MLRNNTRKFLEWAETCMPNLIGKALPDIEEFDGGATLEYELPKPLDKEDVMDIFEDDMDLSILYNAHRSDDDTRSHISAVTNPTGIYMFKFNAVSDSEGMVSNVTAVIYESVDEMAEEVLNDIHNMEQRDFIFDHKIEDGVLTALFCE